MSSPLTKYNLWQTQKAQQRRERVKRLRARGMSYAAIGRQLALSRQRVHQIMNEGKP